MAQLLARKVLANIANLDGDSVLFGQDVPARQARRRSFPDIDFYGDQRMPSGLVGHRHPRPELATVISGSVHVGINERTYRAQAGDLLVFAPEVLHGECAPPTGSGYRLLWFVLAPEMAQLHLTRFRPRQGYTVELTCQLGRIPPALGQPLAQLWQGPWPDLLAGQRLLLQLLAWCLQELCAHADTPAAEHPLVGEVRALLEQLGPSRLPTVVELANRVGLSPNYLSDLFHRNTGQTLRHFMQQQRVRQAQQLLSDPKLSVKQIAQRLGFADASHFSHAFRGFTGVSPSEFRATVVTRVK